MRMWVDVLHPEDRETTLLTLKRAIEEHKPLENRYRIQHSDGSARWIGAWGSTFYDGSGAPRRMCGICMDITERKEEEDAWWDNERRYHSLFDHMLNGLAYCRVEYENGCPNDFTYLSVNAAFESLTGLKNVIGKKASEVIPGIKENDVALVERYARVAETGVSESFEYYVNSLQMWFAVSAYSPTHGYFVSMFDVVTERKKAEEDLRVALQKYRTLFDSFPWGIVVSNKDGEILEANPMAEVVLKVPMREICHRRIDDPYWRRIRLDGSPFPIEELASVRALNENRVVANVEMGLEKSSGEVSWISATAAPLPLDGYGVVVTYSDISDRKHAEDALRESEERFRSLFQEMEEGFFLSELVFDDFGKPVDWRFLDVNPAHGRIMGMPRERVVGYTVKELFPELEEYWMGAHVHVALTGEPLCIEGYVGATGRYYVNHLYSPRRGQFACIFTDITEHKRAEEQLRLVSGRYTAILEALPDLIMEMDRRGVYTWANPAGVEFYGEDVVGSEAKRYFDNEREFDIMLHSLLTAKTDIIHIENTQRRCDKQKRILLWSCKVLRNEFGEATSALCSAYDATDYKHLEEQLLQAQKMEAIGQLAGGVAHDFNNLLQVIMANSELAQSEQKPGSVAWNSIEEIRKAGERAADLTRQLLTFGRRQIIKPVTMNLNDLINGVLKMLRRVIGEHISLVFVAGEDLGAVFVDKTQIEQVIINLCVNARDAMPQGGKVTIRTENTFIDETLYMENSWSNKGKHVLLSVSDTGHGMDAATQARIFEPFFTTKEQGKGTGLGLATVYGIVKQHEGMIHVYSEPGSGTVFKIYIPVTNKIGVEPKAQPAAPAVGGTETIFIAEDEPSVLLTISAVLRSAGYTVLSASNGNDALRILEENAHLVDLAILDVVMPGLSGKQIMDKVRPEWPKLRFLFSSGYNSDAISADFIVKEGFRFIQKPYSKEDLLREVRISLESGAAKSE